MKITGILLTLLLGKCSALVCDEGWKLYDSKGSGMECHPTYQPKGYRKCLKMFTAKKSWEKAEESCEEKEGNLVKIESKEENTFLLQEFLIVPNGEENIEAWTGLTDKEEEGKFVWTDGQTPSSACTKWADEQPNDEDGEQDCAEIANGVFWPGGEPQIGLWNDFQCHSELNYICEKGREEYDLSS